MRADPPLAPPVGVVSHLKVLSDRVADVSSLAAWRRSFIRPEMTAEEKALAVWQSSVAFVYQDAPPLEFAGCVHDAIKDFNVYGYGMCCCASARLEELARYVGLPARGFGINGHSVPEVFWDDGWHLLDASLVNYFRRTDGQLASVADLTQAVQGWFGEHPGYRGNDAGLRQFQQAAGWTGWRQGPPLLARCSFYDAGGWWPAKTHGWYSTMQEFDGSHKTPFPFEYGYSQGYEVNLQLRRGERLTRNWFNRGLHVNGILHDGGTPGCLTAKVGEGAMAFLRQFGDLNEGRVGTGTLEYEVPLADGGFRDAALAVENLACRQEAPAEAAVHVADPAQPGTLELDLPTSYVYLTGQLALETVMRPGGQVRVWLSDNNGGDWCPVATITAPGARVVDLQSWVLRRYDYRLRLVLEGPGTGLNRLALTHDVQCSQRALPTLGEGDNTLRFSAGPDEGTVTIEGAAQPAQPGKRLTLADFHPVRQDVREQDFQLQSGTGAVTFSIATPGEMTRLRLGGHYRLRDARDQWSLQLSFDEGRTFRTVATQTGPFQGICQYVTVTNVPAGTRAAQVRWVGRQRNTTCLFFARIDADYRQPRGGFRPVKITYVWDEAGGEHRDTHVARAPRETYRIHCGARLRMKSLILELAE